MRPWELVGGGSATFWEVSVEGASARLRRGRIGSEGLVPVKEPAFADAARADVVGMVAEKEREGYVEIAAGDAAQQEEASAGPVGLPEEDAFFLPEAWRALVLPHRGGAVRAVAEVRPDAAGRCEERIAGRRAWIEEVLASPDSGSSLALAARAYLAGEPGPLGAAAVASMLPDGWEAVGWEESLVVDAWVAEHGLVFAARAEVAKGLGLTGEQLSDRLVPDLGLDADGTTVVRYGPRHFTVGFDEQLRPFVLDSEGQRRRDLPAPGVQDDPELAPAERKRFTALKKDVRTIGSDQVRRAGGGHGRRYPLRFGALDAVAASGLLADLEEVTAG